MFIHAADELHKHSTLEYNANYAQLYAQKPNTPTAFNPTRQ